MIGGRVISSRRKAWQEAMRSGVLAPQSGGSGMPGAQNAPVPWDPTLYGTVISRWDFSGRASTLYQAITQTGNQALANNDPIGCITDPVGSVLLAAFSGTHKASLKLAVQNGLNVGQFNGTTSGFSANPVTFTPPFTIMIVYKSLVIGAPGVNEAVLNGDVSTKCLNSDTTPQTVIGSPTALTYAGNICNGVFGQATLNYGTSGEIRENGVSRASGTTGTTAWSIFAVGGRNGATHNTNIQVGEIVVYSAVSNQSGAEAAMKGAWTTP